jgi:hypothetical protein
MSRSAAFYSNAVGLYFLINADGLLVSTDIEGNWLKAELDHLLGGSPISR